MSEASAENLKRLEDILGYEFADIALLRMALTHRSCRFEREDLNDDNQRLEFLGDAVLGFVTASYLYEKNAEADEGALTSMRSKVASGKALAGLAKKIGLGEFLLLGKGENNSGGRTRNSNLADALEAVIGAVYIDGQIAGVKKIFDKHFVPLIDNQEDDLLAENPKGKLQELVQAEWKDNPEYRLVNIGGPAHAAMFTVEVYVQGKCMGHGIGSSKRNAEMAAAEMAISKLFREDCKKI